MKISILRFQLRDIEERTIFLSEIDDLTEYINSFFQLLHFGHGYGLIHFDYRSEAEHPSDIETLLDTIAEKSATYEQAGKLSKNCGSEYRETIE